MTESETQREFEAADKAHAASRKRLVSALDAHKAASADGLEASEGELLLAASAHLRTGRKWHEAVYGCCVAKVAASKQQRG